jgi:hypothetical protein
MDLFLPVLMVVLSLLLVWLVYSYYRESRDSQASGGAQPPPRKKSKREEQLEPVLVKLDKIQGDLTAVKNLLTRALESPSSTQQADTKSPQQPQTDTKQEDPGKSSSKEKSRQFRQPSPDPAEEIRDLFNKDADGLKKKYEPKVFGVINLSELRRKPGSTPEFAKKEDGLLWLLEPPGGDSYIVPIPNMTFLSEHYKSGGMGEIFECQNYKPGFQYQNVVLVAPARASWDGNRWNVKKGHLVLTGEEPEV